MGFMASMKAQKAYNLHGQGKLEEAKKLYEESIAGGMNNPRFLISYSILLIRSGEYERAREILRIAEKAPGLTEEQKSQLFVNYAACMFRMGSIEKGINLLEKRHAKAPCGMIYQTLGYLYVEKFDPANLPDFAALDKDLLAKYEEAVEQAKANTPEGMEPVLPDRPKAAKVSYDEQKTRARLFLDEAVDYDDEDSVCLDNMGQWLYRVEGDKAAALSFFERALEQKENQIDTLYFLSRYDLEKGDTQKAIERLELALEGRFSPLNYIDKKALEQELARLKG